MGTDDGVRPIGEQIIENNTLTPRSSYELANTEKMNHESIAWGVP
jgi:hypothetical protein